MHHQTNTTAPLVDQGWSARMADSVIARHRPAAALWHYEHGLVWQAIEQLWRASDDPRYWQFVRQTVDLFVQRDGSIRTYRVAEYNLDQINPGKLLFPLLEATGEERYRAAIELLRGQLRGQPRTASGGFWHKQIYPFQMWLDGLYMAGPFYARYVAAFGPPDDFDDVAHQFALVAERTRDDASGLLYHAWDESKSQRWADPQTGRSPHFWGRALGWYLMALVDALDFLPEGHPQRPALVDILARAVDAMARVQDRASGVWYQLLDLGGRPGNYLEASVSCMTVYAVAKGVRKGYLPASRMQIARRGYAGILEQFVTVDEDGLVSLQQTCGAAGLGGTPYRDGSYEYYTNERIVCNDYKGIGPFILAAIEMERDSTAMSQRGQ